jgi:hypothetical protein
MDACVASACEHTPTDALCDDGNDCTDDICNAVTGCVHANLTGNSCEDGDLCTVTGTCSAGKCVPSDASLSGENRIIARLRDGPDNDKLTFTGQLPLADLTTVPTDTGLVMELRDADSQTVFAAMIAPGDFQVSGTKYYFRDPNGLAVGANGVRSVTLTPKPTAGIAKVKVSMGTTEIPGALGQPVLSMSLLFGTDPALDDCLTARRIPCIATAAKTSCRD